MAKPSVDLKSWLRPALEGGVIVAIATGLLWLGGMSARLNAVEQDMAAVQSGPRGRSCEHIVQRITQAIESGNAAAREGLEAMADEWGCSAQPLAFTQPKDEKGNGAPKAAK